jgi:hypothetical protein
MPVIRSRARVAGGVVVALFGLLFMFQGLGYVKGSSMTDSDFWAVTGPIIAACGFLIGMSGMRRRER